MKKVSNIVSFIIIASIVFFSSCQSVRKTGASNEIEKIKVNIDGKGKELSLTLQTGNSHNHPTFAIWAETLDENFIQTLFVTKSIATGIFGHGPLEAEKWDTEPGWQIRPAALPYWIHKRKPAGDWPQLPDPEHPVSDAYTGATPKASSQISTRLDNATGSRIRIMMEINQPWDWNEYWTNKKYDDADYRTSCQPSLVYSVTIDLDEPGKEYHLNPIGHGHYSGADGELYTDLTTMTTALDIISSITVEVAEKMGE